MESMQMTASENHRRVLGILVVVAVTLVVSFAGGVIAQRSGKLSRLIQVSKLQTWSIGIFTGASLLSLSSADVRNPVLTAQDVTDVQARFVADPFMVCESHEWYMFFEIRPKNTNDGYIGLATSSDGLNWTYAQVVLHESFHLSYPYVFKWKRDYYMIPETQRSDSVWLYKASLFPTQWARVGCLLPGEYVDPCVIYYGEKWWLFGTGRTGNSYATLHLFYADTPYGPWVKHPASPVVKSDKRNARGGGRILVLNDKVFRFAQDDAETYGRAVRALQITSLTTTRYEEQEVNGNPVLGPSGSGWNADGMHTLDAHELADGQWIACVDGTKDSPVFKFNIFDRRRDSPASAVGMRR
jgi:hypothetical protein